MAMIDYGSVVKKNGVIIQKEMFMNMKESIGFVIDKLCYKEERETSINNNFFSYMGDKELLICIYKTQLWLISNNKIEKIIWYGTKDGYTKLPYSKQVLNFEFNNIKFKIKRLYNQERFKLRFHYKGDLYECIYGYGVDVNKDIWYDVSKKERIFIDKWFE